MWRYASFSANSSLRNHLVGAKIQLYVCQLLPVAFLINATEEMGTNDLLQRWVGWEPIHGIPCLSPDGSWDRHQTPEL